MRGWGGAAPGYLLTDCLVRGELEQGCLVCSLLRGRGDTLHGRPALVLGFDKLGSGTTRSGSTSPPAGTWSPRARV
ncbi:hypothetical protein C0L86_20785 [Streptomyces sp. SCA2-2]|nr:hypothetical protein C0L86_20785 [Streptomyces sp. SCA2-2]